MRSRALSMFTLVLLLLTIAPSPPAWAAAPDKVAMHAEMLALTAQMEQLKPQVGGDAAAAASYATAATRYRELSVALGGDDPGQQGLSGQSAVPQSVQVAPPAPAFCNSGTTVFTNSTPVAIPTGPAVVTSTVVVAGAGTYLFDVDLTTFITHTFAADLDVTLQSPAGTIVTLTSDNGAGNDNVFNGTVWDDDANPAGQVPYTTNNGVVTDHAYVNLTLASPLVPEEAMGAFIGEDPNGTWTITISDDLAGDGGSLDSWSLDLTTATCVPPSADLGITKTSGAAGAVGVGDQVVFTLTATNNGPGPATGVAVTDTIPAGLAYVSNDCGAAFVAPTLTWTIGNLAAAGSAVCNVTVTAAAPGASVNTATVTADQTDPLTTNNASSATVTAQQSVLEIPTLDGLGLAALALLLAGAAFLSLRRRRA